MKKILAFVVIIFAAFWVSEAFSQNIPSPYGYVNDFANIIPSDVEREIGQAIRDFEAKTTTEIAVVTVPSLQGLSVEDYTMKLAEKWKVGKEEKDNGLIFLVAPNEKKVRIEVGYGLEGVMPDAQAKMIIERVIIPKFKSGDMAGGIKAGVNSIISKIESANSQSLSKEEAAAGKEESDYSLVIGIVASLIGVSIFSFPLARYVRKKYGEWRREANRRDNARKEAINRIKRAENSLADACANLEELKKVVVSDSYPERIVGEMSYLLVKGRTTKEKLDALLMEVEYNLKKNPDSALSFAKEAESQVESFRDSLYVFKERKESFDKAWTSHKDILLAAENALKDFESYLSGLKQKGYKIFVSDKILEECSGHIKSARKRLEDNSGVSDYEAIVRDAEVAKSIVASARNYWEKTLIRQTENDKKIHKQSEWLEKDLPLLRSQSGIYFRKLAECAPPEVWEPVEKELKQEEKWASALKSHLIQAVNLNNMDNQKFNGAEEVLAKANLAKKSLEDIFSKPRVVHLAYIQAKNQAENLIGQVEAAISGAENAINYPDAEGAGRSVLQKSKEDLSKANELKKSNPVNWLLVVVLLSSALGLAQKSESEVRARAEEVERCRRRRREEEEERRREQREEEEEERRRSSYYSSSSVWSSTSSSSSSSFGGFGGGSFGGGGASGGW